MSNTVICTNHLCGKEYHIDFEKCPFCGTANPQIDIIIEKRNQKSRAAALKLEHEKRLEELSGGSYQSKYRLLVEGGQVKGAQINVWEVTPTYAYVIGLISFIICSIVGALLFIPSYPYSEWLLWGFLTSLTGLLFFTSQLLYSFLLNKDYDVRPANGNSPFLTSILNSVGTVFLGNYRNVGDTHVSYVFLSVIFPIFPIGCYRVTEGKTTSYREGAARVRSTAFKIFGSEKWNLLEILNVYLSSWSTKGFVLCIVWLIGMLLS